MSTKKRDQDNLEKKEVVQMVFKIEKEFKKKIRKIALDKEISIASFINTALKEHIKK